ncbi:hypothetical protein E2C01_078034 [Portunus trituberculatus]|uniref:Uncharacterized protein n=1 Tax=Portunus trituberculatus TaxID=210409 RepID=A0A5B7INV0_PORTR|nr:hypothetical protein [Portunus trituberculatus]
MAGDGDDGGAEGDGKLQSEPVMDEEAVRAKPSLRNGCRALGWTSGLHQGHSAVHSCSNRREGPIENDIALD